MRTPSTAERWARLGVLLLLVTALGSCSRRVTTPTTRLYHALTARYNVLYNAETAYETSMETFVEALQEDYHEPLTLDPLTPLVRGARPAGDFSRSREKVEKAIREHSLQRKPAKKPGWRRDPRAVAEQAKSEYNPALSRAWRLWGQSYFYEGRMAEALATFEQMADLYTTEPELRDEARLWQARCFLQQDRLAEALHQLQRVDSSARSIDRFSQLYHTTRAEYYLLRGARSRALPHLQQVVRRERNRYLRARLQYLLGQTHEALGQRALAQVAYERARGMSPKPALEFAAHLRAIVLREEGDQRPTLQRLLTRPTYRPYQDQIYLALGEASLQRRDTLRAMGYLRTAIDSASGGGMTSPMAGVMLGELELAQRHYPEAATALRTALSGLSPEHPKRQQLEPLLPSLERLAPLALELRRVDSLRPRDTEPRGQGGGSDPTPSLLLRMAQLLSGELHRPDEAEGLYARLTRDYPEAGEDLEARYRYLLLSLSRGRAGQADSLRQTLLRRYPEAPQTKLLSGADYRERLLEQDTLATGWYAQAYEAYREGRIGQAEHSLSQLRETLPMHSLQPQSLLLGALIRAQRGDQEGFQRQLTQIARTYPEGDVAELATRMLVQLQAGRRIVAGAGRVADSPMVQDTTMAGRDSLFSPAEGDVRPEVLVLYSAEALASHEALFALTAFLYQHFTQWTLEVTPWEVTSLRGLRVRGFQSEGDVERFLARVREVRGLGQLLGRGSELLPITEANLARLTAETIEDYRAFLRTHSGHHH